MPSLRQAGDGVGEGGWVGSCRGAEGIPAMTVSAGNRDGEPHRVSQPLPRASPVHTLGGQFLDTAYRTLALLRDARVPPALAAKPREPAGHRLDVRWLAELMPPRHPTNRQTLGTSPERAGRRTPITSLSASSYARHPGTPGPEWL
jgi:hypothetical protein